MSKLFTYFRQIILTTMLAISLAIPSAGDTHAASETERLFWQSIQNSKEPSEYQAYLDTYPNGTFAALARIRLKQLREKAAPAKTKPIATKPTPKHYLVPRIRDAELEEMVAAIAQPILSKAGLAASQVQVHIVPCRRLDLFLLDGRSIYINEGVITQFSSPNQIAGLLALQAGHILNGDRSNDRLGAATDRTKLRLTKELGMSVKSGKKYATCENPGKRDGTPSIPRSTASRQASAADTGAVRLLDGLGQSAKGLISVLTHVQATQIGNAYRSPYAEHYPITAKRIARLRKLAKRSPAFAKRPSPIESERYELARKKLIAYRSQNAADIVADLSSSKKLADRYATAIATFYAGASKKEGLQAAMPLVEGLISTRKTHPYFTEVLGHMQYHASGHDFRNPKADKADKTLCAQAVANLEKAIGMTKGQTGPMRVAAAKALQCQGGPDAIKKSVSHARRALRWEPADIDALELASIGYRLLGQADKAFAYEAKFRWEGGEIDKARTLAKTAITRLRTGSPLSLQLKDLLQE